MLDPRERSTPGTQDQEITCDPGVDPNQAAPMTPAKVRTHRSSQDHIAPEEWAISPLAA